MFNESNTIEEFVLNRLKTVGWEVAEGKHLPRVTTDVFIPSHLQAALERLNPEIAERPELGEEVVYRLKALLLAARGEGLVRANEEFFMWLRGDKSMPFGPNGDHVSIRLLDFDDMTQNRCVVANQVTFKSPEKRFDVVGFINGLPLFIGELKTPVRPSISWMDGADQVLNDYEPSVPEFFVPNVLSFATEGKTFRFAGIKTPLEFWAPWRDGETLSGGFSEVEGAIKSLLRPETLLDIARHFTLFAAAKGQKIKVLPRFQQYFAANQIVARVVEGLNKKGLIWHFQGSGKSLLMVFAANKLRAHQDLKNPTVLIVTDRIDLDSQITGTFATADVPNLASAKTRKELENLLQTDARKVVLTTIHRFGEASGLLNARSNIIVLVDEAHRTQEGDLGHKMREALPNAFLFGFTGTPINKRDRNTFWAFGSEADEGGYLNRYGFEEALRDEATLPLDFEPRLIEMRVDKAKIDEAFAQISGELDERDQDLVARQAAKLAVLVKVPERVKAICADIASHFLENVDPNGFKAQVVCFDRESCVSYKQELDVLLGADASTIVMTAVAGDPSDWKQYDRARDDEEKILDRFRDKADPLKILIVTSKLLTGFDAPILQTMYLDKPMKEHGLLQAICRTNRPYPEKRRGRIVDYLGVFDDIAKALAFDEKSVTGVITDLQALKAKLPLALEKTLAPFEGIARDQIGFETLLEAQNRLPNNETRDLWAAEFSVLARTWEALSPDEILNPHRGDYRWLCQVYESLKPPSGNGKLLWHALGAKTIELIHENVHVEAVRDDIEKLVLDAAMIEELAVEEIPGKGREIVGQIVARLRRHDKDPKFIALGQRVEDVKERFEQGLISSVLFLKELLQIAKDVVEAEKQIDPAEEQNKAKAALTELFQQTRGESTPAVVERIVADIDAIVKIVRFDGWQSTAAGTRGVKQALRKTLLKYQLHREQELFERAYDYIEVYY